MPPFVFFTWLDKQPLILHLGQGISSTPYKHGKNGPNLCLIPPYLNASF